MSPGHADRCCNPFNSPSHKGKSLRKLPKKIREIFPNFSENARICCDCRKRLANESYQEGLPVSTLDENLQDSNEDVPEAKKQCMSREEQLELLLTGLKEKLVSLPKNDPLRLSILTVAPDCWSIRDIATEFNVSHRMATAAKNLKKQKGILAMPGSKKGKVLPEATICKVKEFYENDENSRVMPNKKDVISIKINGEKQHKQKRLMLCDIKALHVQFKQQFPSFPLSLSKFAELRPPWCVLAGASGTHSVCVCVTHQNFKSMYDTANLTKLTRDSEYPWQDYNDCIAFVLCKNPTPACYLGDCKSCPNIEKFSEHVANILDQSEITELIFSTWQSVDRCTLIKQCLPVHEFVAELSSQLNKLLVHHFIAKNQSKYIKERKENLQEDEVLLQCDFSENFAYIAQNAAQAFHYNNEQCTVHTVVFYYKRNNEIKHQSVILLSDSTVHDTAAVYIMQQKVIPFIKETCPKARNIIYATDGAKQHYKNKFQMANLVKHKDDFGLEGEWHYHATAHGKGACDGLGAVLKKEATRASLQASATECILNKESLVIWAKRKFPTIKIFDYSKQDHTRIQRSLAKRFSTAPSVMGITKGHQILIKESRQLVIMRYSGAQTALTVVTY